MSKKKRTPPAEKSVAAFDRHEDQLRRNRLAHRHNMDVDLVLNTGHGKVSYFEVKHHSMSESPASIRGSIEHLVPHEMLAQVSGNLAEDNDTPDLAMPEIGQKLLPFIVPRKLREAVAGDLAEDFQTYATKWGRPYALRQLWWELAGLVLRRFGPAGIITAVAMWFRQKIGW
jgi:hypothetical protein